MEDVNISKYRASVVRDGSKPASPGFVVSEGQDPVNPPGTNNYVPYSGATANVELGEYGVEAGFITLDTTPTNTPADQGAIYWDDARSTAALIMNGTLQHIGQDTFFYVKNSSAYTIPKGTCVRFAGTDGASGHLLILPFTANGAFPSSYFMGVTAEDIANGEFGQVMHFGELTGIDTTGYTAGALLYASSTVAGAFQTTAPVAPNNIVLVAAAINSKNNGAIIVRPQIGSNINNDEGVKITSPTTGDLLQLQAGGLWENKTIDGAGIVTKATSQVISGLKTFNVNTLMMQSSGNANAVYLSNSSGSSTYQSGFNFFGFNTDNHIYFAKSSITGVNTGILAWTNTATRTYTLKDASGTIAFTSDIPANPVGGTGTTNYLPKFTGSTTIGNSNLVDVSGNLGLGVTPSAWSVLTAMQIKGGAFISGYNNNTYVGANWYFDGSVGRYLNNDFATSYIQTDGEHQWLTATSGTAGNAISFTQAMTLTSGGNLLVGTTTDNGARLQVSGTATFSSSVTAGDLISTSYGTARIQIISTANNTNAALRFTAKDSGGTSKNSGLYYVAGTNTSNTFLSLSADDNNYQFNVLSSGNVGIGTSSPSNILHIFKSTYPIFTIQSTSYQSSLGIDTASGLLVLNNESNAALGFNTNATERMRITSSGNVGIGTSSPSYRLVVNSGTDGISAGVAGSTYGIRFDNGGTFSSGMSTIHGVDSTLVGSYQPIMLNGLDVRFGTSANERMRITSSGNVGIGTSSPSYPLQVRRAGGAGSLGISIDSVGTTDRVAQYFAIQDNASGAGTGHAFYYRVPSSTTDVLGLFLNESGNVGINTSSPSRVFQVQAATSAYGQVWFLNSSSSGEASIHLGRTNQTEEQRWTIGQGLNGVGDSFALYTGGSNRLMVTTSGNVLIGTTTDVGARLHLNGDIRTSAPSGGSAVNWKLGTVRGGTVTPNATVRVEIGGVLVDLDARYV